MMDFGRALLRLDLMPAGCFTRRSSLNLKFLHPFPARMAPAIVFDALSHTRRRMRVLDPMMGSGTTLLAARLLDHEAAGVDLDPLAVLIASTSTRDLPVDRLRKDAGQLMSRASEAAQNITLANAYPPGADHETRAFVRYWFDATARRQLAAISEELAYGTYTTKAFMRLALSRMIIAKQGGVSRAIDVSHSRPHRRREGSPTPRRPFDIFLNQIEAIVRASSFQQNCRLPKAQAKRGDCRLLPFNDAEFDYVLTSPPYLNAIDYLRGHKLSLVWLGYQIEELRAIRSESIGTDCGTSLKSLDHIIDRMVSKEDIPSPLINRLRTYVADLSVSIGEMRRVTRAGGTLHLVIGDCSVRGIDIRNSVAIDLLAQQLGFERIGRSRRDLPPNRRYLPPPSNERSLGQLQQRMRQEIILRYRAC